MQALDAASNAGGWSNDVGFTVDHEAPAAPSVIGPVATQTDPSQTFAWSQVTDTTPVTYDLELATDAGFLNLVLSLTAVAGETEGPHVLEDGGYFWRVAAVSATGLDGFSSPAAGFTSLGRIEGTPPAIRIDIVGRKTRVGDRLIANGGLRLAVKLEDDGSGPDRYETFVNDEKVPTPPGTATGATAAITPWWWATTRRGTRPRRR